MPFINYVMNKFLCFSLRLNELIIFFVFSFLSVHLISKNISRENASFIKKNSLSQNFDLHLSFDIFKPCRLTVSEPFLKILQNHFILDVRLFSRDEFRAD